jgi:hypothetical protein
MAIGSSTAHPAHVGTLPGPGMSSRIRPVMRDPALEGPVLVPVSCRLSAAGIGLLGRPVPATTSVVLAGDLPTAPTGRWTVSGLPRSTCARYDRGRAPPWSRDGGAHPAGPYSPAVTCRFSSASPEPQQHMPSTGLDITRHHRGFTHVRPSGLPLTCDPRMAREPLDLNPELRTPPLPATHVRAGTGIRALTWDYATDISRPPICESTRIKRHRVARRDCRCSRGAGSGCGPRPGR